MSKRVEITGIIVGVAGIVPWVLDMAGVNTTGVLAPFLPTLLDIWRVVSPFALVTGGMLVGWFIRDNSKTRDAETAARIERDNAEHAAKMKREREAYEAEKLAEEERSNYEAKIEKAAVRFKAYDPLAKVLAFKAYNNGSVVFDIDLSGGTDKFSREVSLMTECETLQDGRFCYMLEPWVRKMFEAHPELLDDTRRHLEFKRAAADREATLANPANMLSYMGVDELRTLQELVDRDGRLDLNDDHGKVELGVLQDFGVLYEYFDNPIEAPIYSLDNTVLEFFKQKENENLIAMYLADIEKNE